MVKRMKMHIRSSVYESGQLAGPTWPAIDPPIPKAAIRAVQIPQSLNAKVSAKFVISLFMNSLHLFVGMLHAWRSDLGMLSLRSGLSVRRRALLGGIDFRGQLFCGLA